MIYKITHEIVSDFFMLQAIYENLDLHYYWSDDYSREFYIALAKAGFINVSTQNEEKQVLICEIQKSYAILHFNDMHASKKVKKLQKQERFVLKLNTAFAKVIEAISTSHENSWLVGEYANLMQQLHQNPREDFSLISCELYDAKNQTLVAGEIGYFTKNRVYTSLSGFHLKEKEYNNCGTLQLILLGEYLKTQGIRFWNLGHPYMQYKLDLGAKILEREDFLRVWYDGY